MFVSVPKFATGDIRVRNGTENIIFQHVSVICARKFYKLLTLYFAKLMHRRSARRI